MVIVKELKQPWYHSRLQLEPSFWFQRALQARRREMHDFPASEEQLRSDRCSSFRHAAKSILSQAANVHSSGSQKHLAFFSGKHLRSQWTNPSWRNVSRKRNRWSPHSDRAWLLPISCEASCSKYNSLHSPSASPLQLDGSDWQK